MTAEARRPLPWRRWALDAVVVTVFLTATLGSNAHENYDVRIAGAALLAAAVLLYRHRQPLAVLALLTGISVAVTAMGPGLASFDLGVAFAVYAVARAHPARVAWPAAAASVAILAVALATWAVAADGTVKAHGGFIITGATSGLAAVATITALTPVSLHRGLFHHHAKRSLVRVSNVLLQATLLAVLLTLAGTTLLIFDLVGGMTAGVVAGSVVLLLGAVAWFVSPTVMRIRMRAHVSR